MQRFTTGSLAAFPRQAGLTMFVAQRAAWRCAVQQHRCLTCCEDGSDQRSGHRQNAAGRDRKQQLVVITPAQSLVAARLGGCDWHSGPVDRQCHARSTGQPRGIEQQPIGDIHHRADQRGERLPLSQQRARAAIGEAVSRSGAYGLQPQHRRAYRPGQIQELANPCARSRWYRCRRLPAR